MGHPVEYRIFPDFLSKQICWKQTTFFYRIQNISRLFLSKQILVCLYVIKKHTLFPIYTFPVMSGPVYTVYKSV